MRERKRLDVAIFDLGLAESREKAQRLIMAGVVYVNDQKADKAGMLVTADMTIEVRGRGMPYVSRGGYKLEKAMAEFGINLKDKITMDIGASTGGFTDCMLQNDAAKVYAVDVGYGQLAWKLRTNPKVINLERTNVRYVTGKQIPDEIDFASVDVSFISLKLILPVLRNFLTAQGEVVCLVKPQFEAGRGKVGKKGVVRDPQVHREVLTGIVAFAKETGFTIQALSFSPIKGPEGNIEFLLYLAKDVRPTNFTNDFIDTVISHSHNILHEG